VTFKDVYFVYFLAGLTALAAVAYAVRIATRGVARNERVGRIGGTALVGQELMDWTYWAVEPIVKSGALVARPLTARGLHRRWSAVMPKDLAKTDFVREFVELLKEYAPVQRNFGDRISLASNGSLLAAARTDGRGGVPRIYVRTIEGRRQR